MEKHAAQKYKKLRKEYPPDHVIWQGKRDDSFVRVEDLAAMVRRVALSNNLMNAYADILDMQIGLTVTSTYQRRFFIFDTSCWKYITDETPESIIKRKQKIDDVLEKMSYPRHMMFPFLVKLQKGGEAERWALLCFDTEVHLWTHYNPVVRKDDDWPDNSGWQITQMKQYIETKMKEAITQSTISRWVDHRKEEFKFPMITSKKAPIRHRGARDSGYVVCYIMERISTSNPIEPSFSEDDLNKFKAEMFATFIED